MKKIAEDIIFYEEGTEGYTGFGKLGEGGDNAIITFSNLISSMIGLMTIIAIIWFVFVFIIGALGIITSGGDKAALETSRKKITSGIVGLIVTVLAVIVIRFIGDLIGLENILDVPKMFETLLTQ